MGLSASAIIARYADHPKVKRSYAMGADLKIWEGGFTCIDADGFAVKPAADLVFIGLADQTVDNTGGSAGDLSINLQVAGDFQMALAGAVRADIGSHVFCSDDETLTLTQSTNPYVGLIIGFVSAGVVAVRLRGSETSPASE